MPITNIRRLLLFLLAVVAIPALGQYQSPTIDGTIDGGSRHGR